MDKYARAEKRVEAIREQMDKFRSPETKQLIGLLIVAEMLVDVARSLSRISGSLSGIRGDGVEVRIDKERR